MQCVCNFSQSEAAFYLTENWCKLKVQVKTAEKYGHVEFNTDVKFETVCPLMIG